MKKALGGTQFTVSEEEGTVNTLPLYPSVPSSWTSGRFYGGKRGISRTCKQMTGAQGPPGVCFSPHSGGPRIQRNIRVQKQNHPLAGSSPRFNLCRFQDKISMKNGTGCWGVVH